MALMGNQGPPQGPKNHLRFYMFMVTLVLGGLFFLLYLNDDESSGNSLITAITGYALNPSNDTEEGNATLDPAEELDQEFNKLLNEGGKLKNYRSVPLELSFNRVPIVQKEATIREVELEFDDLSTTIIVNGDKLELKNLKEVKLSIEDFAGMVNFGSSELSLSGTARRIEVNGVVLASAKDIKVSFGKIMYDYADFDQLVISDLSVGAANGEVTVSDRLNYKLEGEGIGLYNVQGRLTFDLAGSTTTSFIGIVRGIDLAGEILSLEVR